MISMVRITDVGDSVFKRNEIISLEQFQTAVRQILLNGKQMPLAVLCPAKEADKVIVITLEVDSTIHPSGGGQQFLSDKEIKEWAEVQVSNPEMYGMDEDSPSSGRVISIEVIR